MLSVSSVTVDLVVVVLVLILTRIIKSVITRQTGQAPVILEWMNTSGKKQKQPKVVHACIIAEACSSIVELRRSLQRSTDSSFYLTVALFLPSTVPVLMAFL